MLGRQLSLVLTFSPKSGADIAISSRRAHAQGVSFPISPPATDALQQLKEKADLAVVLVGMPEIILAAQSISKAGK